MTSCADMKLLMHGLIDGELDAANALKCDEHLAACGACAAEYESYQALRQAIRTGDARHQAPDALRSRVLAALDAAPDAPAGRTGAALRRAEPAPGAAGASRPRGSRSPRALRSSSRLPCEAPT